MIWLQIMWERKKCSGSKINIRKTEERERMNQLIVLLTAQSRIENLVKAARDADYQEQLFKELGI